MNTPDNMTVMASKGTEGDTTTWVDMASNFSWDTDNGTSLPPEALPPSTSLKVLVFRVLLPILIFIGVSGNFTSFLVLSQAAMRRTPTCLYLAALAVLDTLVLLTGALRQAVMILSPTHLDMATLSTASCKLMTWIFYSGTHSAAWIIVGMSVDRYVTVRNPLRMRSLPMTAITRGIICFIVLLFCITNIHFLVTGEVIIVSRRNEPLQTYCFTSDPDMQTFYVQIYPWLDATLYSYAPLTFLLIFNGLLMYKLCHRDKDFKSETSSKGQASQNPQDQSARRISIVMLSICLLYMVTTTPAGLVWAFNTRLATEEEVVSGIVDFFMYTNHAGNFFIYCLTGARFRAELSLMLGCSKKAKPRQKKDGHPVSLTSTSVSDLSRSVSNSTIQLSISTVPEPAGGLEVPQSQLPQGQVEVTTGGLPSGGLD